MSKTYLIQENTLTNIADNVRSLTGVEGEISLDTMNSKLAEAKQSVDNVIGTLEGFGVEIPEGTNIGDLAGIIENSDSFGGTDTSDATAAADEIFAGETAYIADGKVTGTFTIESELTEQNDLISQITALVAAKANPSGGTDTSDATATSGDLLSGKTAYAKGEKITGTIPTKAATTYTPTTSNQTIASGTYLTGTQTIKGDTNLKAENIASGVSIFGITGTHSGGTTEDLDTELTTQENLIFQLSSILNNKASGGSGENIETCNVTINYLSSQPIILVSWPSLSDGSITSNILRNSLESTFILQNVIKNSSITIFYYSMAGKLTLSNTEGVTLFLHDMVYSDVYSIVVSASSDSVLTLNPVSCCFETGTQILTTLDGQTRAIESIKADDLVVSYNIETNENYLAKVKKLIIHENTIDIAKVYFGNGTSVTMNAYHPLYTDNGWHSITNHNGYDTLVIGDNVKTINGWTNIIDIDRYTSEPITTYNLDIININEEPDIDTNDAYYANGIVAHNG